MLFNFGPFFLKLVLIGMIIPFIWSCTLLIKNQKETSVSKAIWFVLFVGLPIISSIFYIVNYYVNRKED